MDGLNPGQACLALIKSGGLKAKLRPTVTIDKSKPIFKADGEALRNVMLTERYVHEDDVVDDESDSGQSSMGAIPPPPPAPGGVPPPPPAGLHPPKITPPRIQLTPSAPLDRRKLLSEIKGGLSLRKVKTVDKSAPVIQADNEEALSSDNMLAAVGEASSREVTPQPYSNTPVERDHIDGPSIRPIVMGGGSRMPPKDTVKCSLDAPRSPPPTLSTSVRDIFKALNQGNSNSMTDLSATLPAKKRLPLPGPLSRRHADRLDVKTTAMTKSSENLDRGTNNNLSPFAHKATTSMARQRTASPTLRTVNVVVDDAEDDEEEVDDVEDDDYNEVDMESPPMGIVARTKTAFSSSSSSSGGESPLSHVSSTSSRSGSITNSKPIARDLIAKQLEGRSKLLSDHSLRNASSVTSLTSKFEKEKTPPADTARRNSAPKKTAGGAYILNSRLTPMADHSTPTSTTKPRVVVSKAYTPHVDAFKSRLESNPNSGGVPMPKGGTQSWLKAVNEGKKKT